MIKWVRALSKNAIKEERRALPSASQRALEKRPVQYCSGLGPGLGGQAGLLDPPQLGLGLRNPATRWAVAPPEAIPLAPRDF